MGRERMARKSWAPSPVLVSAADASWILSNGPAALCSSPCLPFILIAMGMELKMRARKAARH